MSTPSQFSSSSTPPPPPYVEPSELPRWIMIAFVIVFLLVGYLVYASVTEHQALQKSVEDSGKRADAMNAALDKANSQFADLKGEMDVMSQKLGLTQDELAHARALAQQVRKEQKDSSTKLASQIGQVQADTATKFGEVSTELSGTKTDVAATKADLEATKAKLQSTVGDLGVQSGLIARNHEEVDELKRLGERNIYEFKVTKTNQMQHVGPIQVTLKKVDTKKYKYTVNVLADDKTIEKKDRTVGEPIQFYVHGARAPYEIVVFDVTKNEISGYLSTPKDAAPASGGGAATTPPGN
jgi:hypothetical protein